MYSTKSTNIKKHIFRGFEIHSLSILILVIPNNKMLEHWRLWRWFIWRVNEFNEPNISNNTLLHFNLYTMKAVERASSMEWGVSRQSKFNNVAHAGYVPDGSVTVFNFLMTAWMQIFKSDLWLLVWIAKINSLFSLKNYLPCRDLNHRPPKCQANKLPIELSHSLLTFPFLRECNIKTNSFYFFQCGRLNSLQQDC